MSYAERLAAELNKAPAREVSHMPKPAYDWNREAGQKRAVR